MEQPVLERALRPVYRRVVVPAAVAICAGILAFGSKLKDELGMVYENISYYELDDVWEGPFVRLALMIAAFLISWAIMFFVPRGKTCLSVIGQNTMPVYMLHRILRDILMFAGIYDYLGDWGWFALFVLICLSICVIYLLVNPKVVNQVNKKPFHFMKNTDLKTIMNHKLYFTLFNRECEKKSVKNNPSMIEYK